MILVSAWSGREINLVEVYMLKRKGAGFLLLFLIAVITQAAGEEREDGRIRDMVCMIQINQAEKIGTGSGFVISDVDGNSYIITNAHVIKGGTYGLSALFQTRNGRIREYFPEIFYQEEDIDLALLYFPTGRRIGSRGLPIDTGEVKAGDTVFSAGYPGDTFQPVWWFGSGKVLQTGFDISHNAPVHPGNSGGPLLRKDESSPAGYSVTGVNVSKILETKLGFAITAADLTGFIDRAFRKRGGRDEHEPNNTPLSASPAKPGTPVRGSLLGEGDRDIYRFSVEAGELQVTTTSRAEIRLDLYDALDSQVPIKSGAGSLSAMVSAGELYLKLGGTGSFYDTYKLTTRLVPQEPLDEGPELPVQAQNGVRIGRTLTANDKEDFFTVDIPADGLCVLETDGEVNTRLQLFDPANSGALIAEDDDSGDGRNARIKLRVNAGTYTVRVSGGGGNEGSGSYRFRFLWGVPETASNTSRQEASPLSPGIPTIASFSPGINSKWYRLSVPPGGGVLSVRTEGDMDTAIALYAPDGTVFDDDSGDGRNARISLELSGGEVFFKVSVRAYSAGNFLVAPQLDQ
jgi:hypothetical protein